MEYRRALMPCGQLGKIWKQNNCSSHLSLYQTKKGEAMQIYQYGGYV